MTFDSNRAWQQATAAIRANREVLFALSGVFFLLPSLAFALLFPQPTPPAGMDERAAASFLLQYYGASVPYMIPVTMLQAGGTLALLTLLTDRRPTVGDAIRTGFVALLPYLASQLLLGLAAGMLGGLALTVAGLTGSKGAVGLALLLGLGALLYIAVRTSLSAPVIAVDGVRNPIAALSRSWRLTEGSVLRIMVFYALILLAFAVVLSVVLTLSGLLLALALPANLAAIVSAVLSAALGAAMALTFVAVLAAVHAQLAGHPAEAVTSAFE